MTAISGQRTSHGCTFRDRRSLQAALGGQQAPYEPQVVSGVMWQQVVPGADLPGPQGARSSTVSGSRTGTIVCLRAFYTAGDVTKRSGGESMTSDRRRDLR
jgi:hypothetical protein